MNTKQITNSTPMADQPRPRVHPETDVEAPAPPPTTPLVPAGTPTSTSAKAIPIPPRGTPLERATPAIQPLHTQFPGQKTDKNRNCWCRCLCWTISLLVLLIILVGLTVAILYLAFKPKIPSYSVESLKITDLRLNLDMSLYARFDVEITAYNPNEKIGIHYERGGKLSVWYTKTKLCEGALPEFYQGHHNRTVIDVALTGQNNYGNALMGALQEQQQTGRIPLDLEIRAPVSIELGTVKLRKVKVLGRCLLVVDSLSTNNLISIKTSDCKFRLKL